MNYCIINGMKSTMVGGLLIQELPPISKPMIRREVLEIDGRSGDIITDLGYSAYDRKMKIGLRRDFDLDNVIAYFNSSGQVIFSNEPDKYYDFHILDQIDFERLLRFREATVVFHVQPYKHSSVEEDLIKEFTSTTPKTISAVNFGNTYANPTVTLIGTGTVNLSLNGIQILTMALGDIGGITIDSEALSASYGGILRNRQVTGDYSNLKFDIGKNTLTWTGNVTEVSISKYSRWI